VSWWSNLFGRKSYTLDSQAVYDMLVAGTENGTGIAVNDESAMSVATVYACVAVLSESVAQLPCHLYTGAGADTRERATKHRLYSLLHDAPNEWMTAFEFWEQAVTHIALGGNFYALKGMVGARGGELAELFPLMPSRVRVKERSNGSPYYVISDGKGGEKEFTPDQIFHIRYRRLKGWCGMSPISYNRETIGLQLAGARMQSRTMKHGAKLTGILKAKKNFSKEAAAKLREQWESLYAGADNAGKTAVLEEGMEFERLSMSNADLQYIEQRKLSSTDICSIYRVPPHMVANLERATHSNIEHSAIEFVVQTLGPWLRRIEAAIRRDLLTPDERKTMYPEFLVDALLRGDSVARGDLYTKLFSVGALNANEIRKRENLPPIGPDGDMRYVPGNLMKLGQTAINAQPVTK